MRQGDVHSFSGLCPICGEHMIVSALTCPTCATELSGSFALVPEASVGAQSREGAPLLARLSRLDATQLEFVEAFLRCRGVIKNVEDMLGISYPTVRARLASVLDALGYGPEQEAPAADRREQRRAILAELRDGLISTDEAHRLLARDQSTSEDE